MNVLSQIRLPKRPLMRAVLAVLVLAVVAGGVIGGIKRFTGLPGDAAFKYGNAVVTQSALNSRIELLGALYGIKAPTGTKAKATFERDSAKAVAVSMILDHAAAAHDIVIADKAARDTLAGMITTQLGSNAAFIKILAEFGVNEQNVLDEIKRQQATARLFQVVTKGAVASVTDAQAQAFFAKNPSAFSVPETRHLANIVVATQQEADAILAQLRAGKNFAALAQKTSLDDSTRSSGGDLGTVDAAKLENTYAAAAFSTPVGGDFGPVQTKFGWNVGTVLAIKPGTTATYATAKAQVVATLQSQVAMKVWDAFLADQIKQANVDYASAYRPAHPDALPAAQPGVPSASASVAP
ncbi:MAG: PpiC-type peptidyl-prolyl cis-trans isomerase [Marmoricola sp.]|nr:PpiC-type peptidyl-prolyl cis-trans isomerase [Marmoricola sp.]